MNAQWPTDTLPLPTKQGFQKSIDDLRLSGGGDGGWPGYRNRYSQAPETYQVRFRFTVAELAAFQSFYKETLKGGTLPFWMADPIMDGQPLLNEAGTPILTSEGDEILMTDNGLFLFGRQLPSIAPVGVDYEVSFVLSRMPV